MNNRNTHHDILYTYVYIYIYIYIFTDLEPRSSFSPRSAANGTSNLSAFQGPRSLPEGGGEEGAGALPGGHNDLSEAPRLRGVLGRVGCLGLRVFGFLFLGGIRKEQTQREYPKLRLDLVVGSFCGT